MQTLIFLPGPKTRHLLQAGVAGDQPATAYLRYGGDGVVCDANEEWALNPAGPEWQATAEALVVCWDSAWFLATMDALERAAGDRPPDTYDEAYIRETWFSCEPEFGRFVELDAEHRPVLS